MSDLPRNGPAVDPEQGYRTLLGVSEAIVAHRDLPQLFHHLAGLLHRVVCFDFLALLLHDPASHTVRLHVLEPLNTPSAPGAGEVYPAEEEPAGWVWQTQRPLAVADLAGETRWPRFLERVKGQIRSFCALPLTTARRRLGVLSFARTQAAYETADVDFLQHVANQVAVAVENALAFRQIEELKEKAEEEKVYLEEEIRTEHNFAEVVGGSTAIRRILREVEIVAPTDSTVLVQGETGTGKELIARAIHNLSSRRQRTFVKVNCAAIPTGLLESELFGHERGAFTGAIAQKVGRFELADGGTLFLDEVGDIPPELQPKLLRVLQEQEFERLGSNRTLRVDVRLVAATNRDLAKMVAGGTFRGDLYYRLNVFPVLVPPLRERRKDIPLLARHFTQRFARRMGKAITTIPTEVMEALVGYPWPGNVRELQNVIERAVILSPGPALHVPTDELRRPAPADGVPSAPAVTLADAERQHIQRALREAGGVLGGPAGAAALLGMKRSTLYWKMKRLGIPRHG